MSPSATNPNAALQWNTPNEREIRTERTFNAKRERVWRAFTVREELAQWWGRGHSVSVERLEVERGGRWRFVEQTPQGPQGFEGRYREVTPPERIVQTFEWDGMPGHVIVVTTTFEDLGDGRTRVVTLSLFHTTYERDGMLNAGMTQGMGESYRTLDALLAASP